MLTLDNLNIDPNEQWFVKLSVDSGKIDIGLFLSRENALSGTHLIASGSTTGFGANLPVTLYQVASKPVIARFAPTVSWDAQVSGNSGDPFEIYQVGPFTDMDDVNHAIYRNDQIIPYKAAALIDERTHLDRKATIVTPKVDPRLEVNKSLHLMSEEMGLDQYHSISGIELEFTPDSMTMTLTASKYERMSR